MINRLTGKVMLILNDKLLRESLAILINSDVNYKLIVTKDKYCNFTTIENRARPDVIITDLQFNESENSVGLIHELKNKFFYSRILVLSQTTRPETVFTCFRAGASGYIVLKPGVHLEIMNKLTELCNGGAPLSSEISRIVVESFHTHKSTLSDREIEVLKLLSKGKTYSQISSELSIAKETSKTHIKNIYAKLKVNSKAEAISKSLASKIIYQTKRTCP